MYQHCITTYGVLIGCFALLLCGPTISSAEDTPMDSPSWSSLRQNSGSPSATDPLSFPDQNRNTVENGIQPREFRMLPSFVTAIVRPEP